MSEIYGKTKLSTEMYPKRLKKYCNTYMKTVDDAVAVAAPTPTVDLSEQLGSIHALYEKGALSLDEYQKAKEKLLGV